MAASSYPGNKDLASVGSTYYVHIYIYTHVHVYIYIYMYIPYNTGYILCATPMYLCGRRGWLLCIEAVSQEQL